MLINKIVHVLHSGITIKTLISYNLRTRYELKTRIIINILLQKSFDQLSYTYFKYKFTSLEFVETNIL